MNLKNVMMAAAAVALTFVGMGTALACGGEKTTTASRTGDIVEVATAAGSFQTLLAAATAAGLVETLKSEGPFTVFAPSDAAFAKLPEGTVEALLKDKKKLAAVLTYHVVSGKVMAADAMKLDSAKTVQGGTLKLVRTDRGLEVDGALVVTPDVAASNGVIHVIDTVMLPPQS